MAKRKTRNPYTQIAKLQEALVKLREGAVAEQAKEINTQSLRITAIELYLAPHLEPYKPPAEQVRENCGTCGKKTCDRRWKVYPNGILALCSEYKPPAEQADSLHFGVGGVATGKFSRAYDKDKCIGCIDVGKVGKCDCDYYDHYRPAKPAEQVRCGTCRRIYKCDMKHCGDTFLDYEPAEQDNDCDKCANKKGCPAVGERCNDFVLETKGGKK